MPAIKISAEDLLAGANASFDLVIPTEVLRPNLAGNNNGNSLSLEAISIEIKPISLGAFQLISKAAKDDPGLIPLLMIKEACVQPELSFQQIQAMHLGLVEFLIEHIRLISGLSKKKSPRN